MKTDELPRTPFDLFQFSILEKTFYRITIFIIHKIGIWRHPINAQGDIAKMKFKDKLYWLYKCFYPVKHPYRFSTIDYNFTTKTKNEIPIIPNSKLISEINLACVGDLINHPFLSNSMDSLYKEIYRDIFHNDISMANLECPIHSCENKEFLFSMNEAPPLSYSEDEFSIVSNYMGRKYTAMSAACNHSLDFGEQGILSTIDRMKKSEIITIGINNTHESKTHPPIISIKNIKIGLLAFTFGLNAKQFPKDKDYLVNTMDLNGNADRIDFTQIKEQISTLKKSDVDFIIAHFHWGLEHEDYPTPEQIKLGRHVAELGVDLILGHHPHVIQPLELYRTTRDKNRIVPIYYSLGNLVNSFSADHLCKSLIAKVKLKKIEYKSQFFTFVSDADSLTVKQYTNIENQTISIKKLNSDKT